MQKIYVPGKLYLKCPAFYGKNIDACCNAIIRESYLSPFVKKILGERFHISAI